MTTAVDTDLSMKKPRRSSARRAVSKLLRDTRGLIGLTAITVIVGAALLADILPLHNPAGINYDAILQAPDQRYWLGTDELGRDILSRLVYGARISLQIVAVSLVGAFAIGSLLGIVAGYVGGTFDSFIMRVMDGILAFPMLVLALAIIAILGPNLVNAMIALMVVNIPGFARVVRGQVLSIREREFVQAAVVIGQSHARIISGHIWPSVAGNVIVYGSLKASTSLIPRVRWRFSASAPSRRPRHGEACSQRRSNSATRGGSQSFLGSQFSWLYCRSTFSETRCETQSTPRSDPNARMTAGTSDEKQDQVLNNAACHRSSSKGRASFAAEVSRCFCRPGCR